MLYLHNRDEIGDRVPEAIEDGLIAHFCEGPSRRGVIELDAIYAWLRNKRTNGTWLACTCQNVEGQLPLMSPRQLDGHRVVLVRHGRIPHTSECPFARLRPFALTVGKTSLHAREEGILDLYRNGREHEALMRVLVAAHYHEFRPKMQASKDAEGRKQSSSRIWMIDRAADLPATSSRALGEVMCNHPYGLRWIGQRLQDLGTQGLFIGTVPFITSGALVFRSYRKVGVEETTVPVLGNLSKPSDGGPYWCIGLLEPTADGCQVVSAYLYPMTDMRYQMPIEHSWERGVAKLLCEQTSYLEYRFGIVCTVRKPIPIGQVEQWPHDFEIHLPNGKSVAIDVYREASLHYRRMREFLVRDRPADLVLQPVNSFGDALMDARKRVVAVVLQAMGMGLPRAGEAGDGNTVSAIA